MKSLGIAVLLAQSGFPVPATMLRLCPFTSIFTRILSNDNLCAGMSSFVVEMTEFREILRFADNRSLVLGDELCAGTESMSATALVAAGIESLVSRGTKFVFATHLHELATLIPDSVRTMHMKVESTGGRLIYDRALLPGPGPALYGLEVCRALDMPAEFLDRASLIRKQMMGWVAPHKSVYSSKVVVAKCEICNGTVGLETHHIIAQADGGRDDAGNLVSLCSACHDAHHGGRILISGWTDVGMGNREFKWTPISTDSEKSGNSLSTDVQQWIQEQRLLKIRVPVIQRMAKQMFGVDLTVKQIKT
jgi:DNA mismatch repair protein MutS